MFASALIFSTTDFGVAMGASTYVVKSAGASGVLSFGEATGISEIIEVCMAKNRDERYAIGGFEYSDAYLHDNVSRRRASTGLALELCGAPVASQRLIR